MGVKNIRERSERKIVLGFDPPLLQVGPPSKGSKEVKVQLEATNKTNDVTECIALIEVLT